MKIELVGTGSIGATQSSSSTLIDDKLLIDIGNGIVKKSSNYKLGEKQW